MAKPILVSLCTGLSCEFTEQFCEGNEKCRIVLWCVCIGADADPEDVKHGGYEIDFEYSDEERNGEKYADDGDGITFEAREGAAAPGSSLHASTEEPGALATSAPTASAGAEGARGEVSASKSGGGGGVSAVESDEDQTIALKQFGADAPASELSAASLFPPVDVAKLWGLDAPAAATAPATSVRFCLIRVLL